MDTFQSTIRTAISVIKVRSIYCILLIVCVNQFTSSVAINEESHYYVNIRNLDNSSSANLLNSSPEHSSGHTINSFDQSISLNNQLDLQNVTKYTWRTPSIDTATSCKDIILHPTLYQESCECRRNSLSNSVLINCDEMPILPDHSLIINPFISVLKYSQRGAGVHLLNGALFLTNDNDQLQLNALDLSNNNLKFQKLAKLFSGVDLEHLESLDLNQNLIGDVLNPVASLSDFRLHNLKSLNLAFNNLRTLDSNLFSGLNQLNDLNLEGNYLIDIPTSSLRTLDRLVKMSTGNNMIIRLENSSFPISLESLMFLNLTQNRIESIERGSFAHLKILTELYLANNRLKEFKITSQCLNELEILDLSENQFESIPNELKLRKLRKLSLSGNRITSIEENLNQLTRLEYVDLSRNFIRTVSSQAFQYLNDLRVLNLATNLINKQSDLNFNLLRNQLQLDILDLSDNKINAFPVQLLINQKNLKKLFLDYNQIDELSNEMLQSLENLEELSISFNLINELKDGLFYYNSNLKLINLHANKIQNVNDNVFIGCSDNLLGLDLSYNELSELPRLALPRLIIINLSMNLFKELNRNQFINLPSLIYLNLSNAITGDSNIIPSSIFNHNRELEFLDLSNNELELIETGAFRNLSLVRINLSKNKIKELDTGTFEELNNLEHLDVSNNELIYTKNGAFYELPRLKTLNLCHNSINYLYSSSFNLNRKLKILKLCNNNLNYFSTEHLNTLEEIEEIDLSSNKLKSLDTNNFANLSKLKTLKLNNNYLNSIGANAFYNLSASGLNLDLSSNRLIDLDSNAFRHILRLDLNLANNELRNLNVNLFDEDNVLILNTLNIASNNLTDFPLDVLRRQVTSLIALDLASNFISHLPSNTDLLTNIKQLDISSNPLSEDAIRVLFTEPKAIKHLNVAHSFRANKLKFDTIETPFLRHLNLSGNHLKTLNSSLFEKISLLEVLDLSGNSLDDLNLFNDIWPLIPNLRKLNFSSNLFSRIHKEHFANLNNLATLDVSSLKNLKSLDCESIGKLTYLSELAIYNYSTLKTYEPQQCFLNNIRLTKLSIEIKSPELKGLLSNFLYGIRSKHLDLTLFNTSLNELPLSIFNALSLKCSVHFNLISSNGMLFTNNNLNDMNSKLLNVRIDRLSNVSLPCDCSIETVYKMMNIKNKFTINGQRKSIFLDTLIGQFDELICNQPIALNGLKLSEIDFNEVMCLESESDNNYSLINKGENRTEKTDLVELSTSESPIRSVENRVTTTTTTSNYNLNTDLSGLLTRSSIRKNRNNLKLKSTEMKSNQVLLSSLSFTKIDIIIIGSTVAGVLFILLLLIRITVNRTSTSSNFEYNCTCQSTHPTNHSPYSSSLNNSLLNFRIQNDNLEPMTMFYMK